jgi:rhamnogalacturonyl hydrolase YesR
VAVGFLAKGTPALMLFGPGLLLAAIVTGRFKTLLRPAHLAGVALLALVAGGWIYSVVAAAGWEAFDQPLLEAKSKGFTEWSWATLGLALTKPFLVVALLLPWSIFLPQLLRRGWWRSRVPLEGRFALSAAAFLVTSALAFTIVPTTESRYFLPLAASAGILFGMAAHGNGRPAQGSRLVDRSLPALAVVLALAAFAVAFGSWPVDLPMRAVAAALGVSGVALVLLTRRRRLASGRALLALSIALGHWLVHTAVLEPARVEKRSLRGVAAAFRPHLEPGETLWTTPVSGGFHHSSLFFYLGHPVRTVGPQARPVAGSALVLFSDEPADRPDYVLPVETEIVERGHQRGIDFVLARTRGGTTPAAEALAPARIRAIVKRATDWQLAHPRHEPRDWTNAVFFAGVLAADRVVGEAGYLAPLMRVGEEHDWLPGPRLRHADDHAIAQTYLDLFRIERKSRMIEPFREVVDRMMASPPPRRREYQPIDYWWCDALFMSPPAIAKLAAVTGESRYLEFMDRLWRETYRLLYDPAEQLFYRDARQVGGARKTFWSRGNGWVLAGLARVLEELPAAHASRPFYLGVYREMAARIAALQPADGLWRADLEASPLAAPGETSGTALFCYALAWGIDRGVLDRERYLPVVVDAWAALYGNVDEEGRLGWVQRPGVGPAVTRAEDWEVYGTGAFLLAAEAVLGLLHHEGSG